jgi:hypothetical protein
MSWTFGGVPFDWQPDDGTRPDWQNPPRLVIRPLLGTLGDVDIVRIGFEGNTIVGKIFVAAAKTAELKALNGTTASLSDGTSSVSAAMQLRINPLLVVSEGSVGEATFTRERAS